MSLWDGRAKSSSSGEVVEIRLNERAAFVCVEAEVMIRVGKLLGADQGVVLVMATDDGGADGGHEKGPGVVMSGKSEAGRRDTHADQALRRRVVVGDGAPPTECQGRTLTVTLSWQLTSR